MSVEIVSLWLAGILNDPTSINQLETVFLPHCAPGGNQTILDGKNHPFSHFSLIVPYFNHHFGLRQITPMATMTHVSEIDLPNNSGDFP